MDEIYDIVKFKNNNGEIDLYPIEERKNKTGQKWDTLELMLKVSLLLIAY